MVRGWSVHCGQGLVYPMLVLCWCYSCYACVFCRLRKSMPRSPQPTLTATSLIGKHISTHWVRMKEWFTVLHLCVSVSFSLPHLRLDRVYYKLSSFLEVTEELMFGPEAVLVSVSYVFCFGVGVHSLAHIVTLCFRLCEMFVHSFDFSTG